MPSFTRCSLEPATCPCLRTRWIPFKHPHLIYLRSFLMLSFHIHLISPCCLCQVSPLEPYMVYVLVFYLVCVVCPTHLNLHGSITHIIFDEEHRSWNSLWCRFLHCSVALFHIYLCTQFWISPAYVLYIISGSKFYTHIIIIIIIIIFIYCNWVVARWQWLFYMST